MRTLRGGVLAAVATLLFAGCMTAARVFLDLPEEQNQPAGGATAGTLTADGMMLVPKKPEEPPPPAESVTDRDSLLALLPRHRSGVVDWVEAVRQGIIRPRPGEGTDPDTMRVFGYDLYLTDGEGPEAFFPHTEHQEWLSCASCHPRVYRHGSASLTPETAHSQKSCGYCHGRVAFPIQACERCHEVGRDLPENRLPATLGATLRLARLDSTQLSEERRTKGIEDMDLVSAYPPAQFPHGQHRIRFQCRACHEKPFPMAQGATILSKEDAHGGGACGTCHNGRTAFEINIDSCYRCHTESTVDESDTG